MSEAKRFYRPGSTSRRAGSRPEGPGTFGRATQTGKRSGSQMMSLGSDWDSPEGFASFHCKLAYGLVWEMTSNWSGDTSLQFLSDSLSAGIHSWFAAFEPKVGLMQNSGREET